MKPDVSLLDTFRALWRERILVLDGAMGTMIQARGLDESDYRGRVFAGSDRELSGLHDVLSLTRPDVVRDIHFEFLDAGADVVETNTFNATRISLKDYGVEDRVREINLAAARIAVSEAEKQTRRTPAKPRFAAGSIGPTSRTASIADDLSDPAARKTDFDELVEAYTEQAEALIEGGVHALLVETVFDPLNAKAALFALEKCFGRFGFRLPILVSATVTESGRLLSGQTLEAFWNAVAHAAPFCMGLNCSLGSDRIEDAVAELSNTVPVYTHCYPNAGLPNALGEYDHTPDIMAGHLERFAERGWLNLVGGCCGSTPGHIRAIARAVEGKKPRVPPPPVRVTRLSGLEPLTVTPDVRFVAVGERTNVTGSRRFARLIRTGDDEAALEAACLQVEQGARVIDVNMDEGMLDSRKSMVRFLNLLASNPRAARVPVMVDSSDWSVIRAGLKCLPGKGIVNSISLKDGEAPFREHAREARSLGAAVVVMAFDEQGQAGTAERKLEICERSYRILVGELEFPPEDILFDLNVFAVATGMPEHDRLALHFIEAAREVKRRFPHSHVSGGLSNLSFSFRGNDRVREAMHAVFLEHAVPAGMDFAIVNPGRLPDPETIPESLRSRVRDVILAARGDAAERLLELAQTLHAGPSGEPEAPPSRESDVFARLCGAIVKGSARNLEADLAEALGRDASPVAIIEGPLLNGMREVGERFGAGRMFLPQVVQSARVMKRAVEILAPRLEKKTRSRVPAASRGRIVLATVKGDVHDIGKNIVETVLACNGYDVINLGERIPPEKIIEAAKDSGADMVGLSGLITPSLEEMCTVARAMKKSGMALPLLIGGAAASAVHTAVKIAPCYGGPVLYIRDASEAVGVVADLADPARKEKRLAETRALFERLVRRHEVKKRSAACLPLEQARRRRARPDTGGVRPLRPGRSAVRAFANEDWDGLRERIDWNDVFRAWGVSGKTGNGRENDERSRMAREIRERGERYLDIALSGSRVDIAAVSGLFYAESLNEDIVLFHDPGGTKRAGVVPTLRRQAGEGEKYCPALSDFILPAGSKTRDVLGVFVVTCRAGASGAIPREDRENDDRGIWERVILNALAEAASRRLHERMSREIDPGLAPGAVSGIRPAPGYPVLPDHAVKRILLSLLRADERIGVTLTENDMMIPESSVCGLYLFHPEARYFNVGWIGRDQVADYAARIGEDVETVEKRLAGNLGYKPD